MPDHDRPTPEQMLARVKTEGEGLPSGRKRGRLKIYFGYAAGVGKTFAMLQNARREKAAGVDVVVGYVELHGRSETEALLEGLEQIPSLKVPYRSTSLREFDLDAALARKPELILVDELAHSNAPTQRHVRRWQDIEELLNAGIDVHTTCNVQHVESLNDVIAQISGIVVRETVPDEVFNRADELELVDISTEDLLERLQEGKVYIPDQAAKALQSFFRKDNLTALRELALRRTATRVHADVETARLGKATLDVWATQERLLVCVGPSPTSAKVIRAAKRMADSLDADWVAVSIDTPQTGRLPDEARSRLFSNLQLAERLGAETAALTGDDVVAETISYAQQRNVTKIVIGKSEPAAAGWLFRRPSVVDRLINDSGDIDVFVIRGASEPLPASRISRKPDFHWQPWWITLTIMAISTALGTLWNHFGLSEANLVMTYLLGVVVVAFRCGRNPAVVASILAVLLFDVLFVPPYYTVVVNDAQYLLTFAVMLFVGLSVSTLAARVRRQAEMSRSNERRTEALYRLGRKLSGINGKDFIAAEAERAINEVLGGDAMILLPLQGHLQPVLAQHAEFASTHSEIGAAQWVYDHAQVAGRGTDTLPSAQSLYLPLLSPNGPVGVLAIRHQDAVQLRMPEYRMILENYSTQIAMALERDRLMLESQNALIEVETEQLRNTLLASVSHDLRTPLAVISGASSSILRNPGMDISTQRELLQTIFDESDRLSRLVENLLRLTQVTSSQFFVEKQWHPVEDVVGSSLRRLEHLLGRRPVNVKLSADVLQGQFDAVLIEQVLVNLLENACRYTPPDTAIDITAWTEGARTIIEVSDYGPGLAPGDEERVFGKFQRGANTKPDSRGAGLGLAICRAIIRAHGGEITARNRGEKSGLIFRICLPVDGAAPSLNLEPLTKPV
jgi:two-component system sensor histidine kinase KdpD